jgi:hypothetical protein
MSRFLAYIVLTLILLCSFAAVGNAVESAPAQDSMTALIEMLTEKGVLTPEECAVLKQRVAQTVKPFPAVETPKPSYPMIKIKLRLQPRFSVVQRDSNQPYLGERDDQVGNDGFSVRRVRLDFQGQLNPRVGYQLQYQSDVGTEDANLHVAQVEWKGWKAVNLVAGQLQTPFGYEIVICDGSLLTIDRSAVSDFLPSDKDIGIRLDSKQPIFGTVNYQLFVGNGSTKYKGNPDSGFLWIGRLIAKPMPSLTIGTNYSTNTNTDTTPYQARFLKKNNDPYKLSPFYTTGKVDERAWSADFQYDCKPITVWGEYIRDHISPERRSALTSDGYYINAGYFIPYNGRQDKVQFVAGYQRFDANTSVRDRFDMTGTTAGINYYIDGFCHMIRLNYIWYDEAVDDVKNDKLILQYQLWF